jgi:hypothetical protein
MMINILEQMKIKNIRTNEDKYIRTNEDKIY